MLFSRHLVFWCVAAAFAACSSCRSTRPKSDSRVQDVTTSGPASPRAGEPKGKPQVFQWVVVKPAATPFAEGEFGYEIEVKTGGEIWCERLCSDFSLDEATDGGNLKLTAVKVPRPGNTTPGMLDTRKQLRGSRDRWSKVLFANVGKQGENILVEDYIDKDHPNFYAVPVMISKVIRGNGTFIRGELAGKVIEVQLPGQDAAETIVVNAEPVSSFLYGAMVSETGSDGKENVIFRARKVILPWSED